MARIDLAARRQPLFVLLLALIVFWAFGLEGIGHRLWIEVDGIVVGAVDIPAKGKPRYATEYVIRAADGSEHTYTAGATDASLPRSMPIGTQLTKKRWQLSYTRDGQLIDDFPLTANSAILGLGLGLLVWGVTLWRAGPNAPESLVKWKN